MQAHEDTLPPGRFESLHQRVAALAFLALMGWGAWQMAGALARHDEMDYPRSWADFREGRLTTTLEKQLDQKLPARDTLIAAANGLRHALTGGTADAVRTGRDGWLFLTEEVRYEAGGPAHLAARADLLQGVERALRQRGVTLLVALVPDKSRVYAAQLREGRYPAYNAARYAQTLDALARRGVGVVDLLTPLQTASTHSEVYYRGDTHWNQTGAALVAQQIARAARARGLNWPTTTYTTTLATAAQARPGDLVRLMGLASLPPAWRPADDLEAPAHTTASGPAPATGGLFGDVRVPVTLVGTSYSQRGNFQGYLQQSLATPVLNVAKDGGGFLQAATAYFADDAFKNSPPQLLVWELPERFLYAPLKDEVRWLDRQGW